MAADNRQNSNRRLAFRIYEQVNLFYQKIDALGDGPTSGNRLRNGIAGPAGDEMPQAPTLPASQILKNDTLNVNISASGIAFTCRESLQQGQPLQLRIILLSRMTVVMTCCEVVYCKPANPYETNSHPFFVGARFVNLTAGDRAELERYIGRRRKQRWVLNGIFAVLLLAVLSMPELFFDLLLETAQCLTEMVWELFDLINEYLGLWLEILFERLMINAGHHATEIVAVYLQTAIDLMLAAWLLSMAWRGAKRLWLNGRAILARKKSAVLYFWGEQTWFSKLKIISVSAALFSGYCVWFL